MFAGSFQGITQTVPLAIYDRFATDFDAALALSAVLVAVSRRDPALREARGRLGGARRCSALRRAPGSARSTSTWRWRWRRASASRWPARRAPARRASCASSPACCAPSAACVRCGEETWLDTASGRDLPPERRRCGYLFQEYALFPHLSAWRNVAYPLRELPRAERRGARAASCSAASGWSGSPTPARRTLSGGERQRVALARALARRPDVAAARRAAVGARRAHARRRRARAGRRAARGRASRPCS